MIYPSNSRRGGNGRALKEYYAACREKQAGKPAPHILSKRAVSKYNMASKESKQKLSHKIAPPTLRDSLPKHVLDALGM